ncbi:MAG: Hpt domain-containing protein [Pseudomonadota bacterium]
MSDNSQLADLRASFFVECEELVEAAQDALNALKASPADSSAIHALFRAVHSIKGNAAAFGLDGLVEFAHGFETSLDLMRSAAGPIGAGTLDLLFRSADLLADLLRVTRDGLPLPDAEMDALLDALDAHRDGALDGDAPAAPEPSAQAQRHFEITFVPDDDLFATGNEPFKLLENLAALGNATVVCDTDKVPALDKLSAENAYLSWRIDLWTDIDASEIVALFEFVEGLCRLNVMECSAPALPDSEAEDAPEDTQEAPPPAPPLQSAAHISPRSIVRVDLERIERLVNLVGELFWRCELRYAFTSPK